MLKALGVGLRIIFVLKVQREEKKVEIERGVFSLLAAARS
jgi:hypothetical protein